MNEGTPGKIVQATPFQRFTIRLIDGKFVRVPKSDLPSTEPARLATANDRAEMRDLFRLVNGRFKRVLNLDPEDDECIGKPLLETTKFSVEKTDTTIAKNGGKE